jgi:galactosyl transferase GMA12/MNN10 family
VNTEEIDMIISQDLNGINAGSVFYRNSDTMKLTVEFWIDEIMMNYARQNYAYQEQDLMLHTILSHPQLLQRVGFLRQGLINAYGSVDSEGRWATWEEGEVAVHFPACKYIPCYLC